MSREKALEIKNLSTGYHRGRETKQVSQRLNLSLRSGMFTAIIGPNGCGKSTLLRTISGLQPALAGSVEIDHKKIGQLKDKQKAKLMSLVLTDRITTAYLSVEDIVGIGRYPYTGSLGRLTREDKAIVHEAMSQCDLLHYAHTAYSELSDGEKQRVMVARALAQQTPVMILDEPTAHLDLPNRVKLMKMLQGLASETGKAILLSTHELDLAIQWCDRVWLMNESSDIKSGLPEQLVLSGAFSDVFSNHTFYFDVHSGTFKMERTPQCYVLVQGNDPTERMWTVRALERKGYGIASETMPYDFRLNLNGDEGWWIESGEQRTELSSLDELLDYLDGLTNV